MGISLSYQGKIAVLDLGADENRFSPAFLDAIDAHLDEVVGAGAQGLVTTGGGKFYSNGLDLDWLAAHGEQAQWYVGRVQGMLARILTLPVPPQPRWSATPLAPGQCWPWRMTFG